MNACKSSFRAAIEPYFLQPYLGINCWQYLKCGNMCLYVCLSALSISLSIYRFSIYYLLLSSDAIDLSICPSMSICIYSYVQVKPARGGWRKFPGLLHYRIQRRGLPIGDAAKLHSFSTLLTTSHFVSPLLNDPHLCASRQGSPQLSFHLSSLFSTLLSSCLSLRSIPLARSICVHLITREL